MDGDSNNRRAKVLFGISAISGLGIALGLEMLPIIVPVIGIIFSILWCIELFKVLDAKYESARSQQIELVVIMGGALLAGAMSAQIVSFLKALVIAQTMAR